MKQVLKYAGYVLLLFVVGFLVWRFSFMIVWILIAAVISFVGHPFVRFFNSLHFKKWHMPRSLSAALALIIIVVIFTGILAIFVPLIVQQAETISRINVNQLAEDLQGPMQWLTVELNSLGMLPDGQSVQDFIVLKAKSLVSIGSVSTIINSFFGMAGTVLIGFISVLFIAFFFMKDESMFENGLLLLVPERHHHATRKVLTDSKHLLMRYFIGVMLEVLSMMSIITLALYFLGVKNALLIGFFGGLMNIIPYLGPVIGTLIGVTLGFTATLSVGAYAELMPQTLTIMGVFVGANLIDNNFLIPVIYSNSVKAHPLEIFFVIIMGGSLAGIPGMLLAIPSYTVLRVIGKEFFQKFRIVQKLTEKIN